MRKLSWIVPLVAILFLTLSIAGVDAQSVLQQGLDYPFDNPSEWEIISGYNNGHIHGAVNDGYDYFYAYYGLDFARKDRNTAGKNVYLPSDVYYYRVQNSSEKCVDLMLGINTSSSAFYLEICHVDFTPEMLANKGSVINTFLPRGTLIGTIAYQCPNCNPPHLHMAAHFSPVGIPWAGVDSCRSGASNAGWCRFPLAFQRYVNFNLSIGGDDYPRLESALFQVSNQYGNTSIQGGGSSEGTIQIPGQSPIIGSGQTLPSWLSEFSKIYKSSSVIDVFTHVDAVPGVYDAHRVLVNGNVLYESSAGPQQHTWDITGYPTGDVTLTVQYRRLSDGGDWNNALTYQETFHIDAPPSSMLPTWLREFNMYNTSLFNVQFHTNVDATAGVYDAHRVLVDSTILYETSAPEYWHDWNTYGWADGDHSVRIEYRRVSDGGNWSNALVHQDTVFLSPDRAGATPCTGGDGVELRSGNDCVHLSQSFRSLDPIGWGRRHDLHITVIGQHEAWAYEGTDYGGSPRIVLSGQTLPVGNNILSVDIRPVTPTAVPPPQSAFTVDANTRYLFPLNEGSGSTVVDIASGLSGSIGGGNWVQGWHSNALFFPNPSDGPGITTEPFEVCPMTVEFWVNRQNNDGRLLGQLGNGPLKWLIGLDRGRPKLEIWYPGASSWIISPYQVEVGAWHYVMATYDCDRTAKLYVDNRFSGELTLPAPMNGGPARFEIGAVEASQRCNCIIDDVRISNTVRLPNAQPPTASLAFAIIDPATGLVEANATWSNSAEDWHILNWGDGAEVGYFGSSGTSLGHANGYQHYYQPGTYTMAFTVKGLDGQIYTYTQTVTIEEVSAPTFSLTATVTDPIHGLVETNASWSEAQENWQLLNWGDGTETGYFGSSGTNVGHENGYTHYYQQPGTYTLTFSVRGLDGVVHTTTQTVTINPPSYSLSATVADPITGLVETNATWSNAESDWQVLQWGDGTETGYFGSSGTNVGHENGYTHYYSAGTYILTFNVKGGNGTVYTTTQEVTINSPAPPTSSLTITSVDQTTGLVETNAAWSGAAENWQLLNWGDGTETGYFGSSGTNVGHENGYSHYYQPGTYQLTFTVTGLDGLPYVVTQSVEIIGGESLMAPSNGGGEQLIIEESSQTEDQQPAEPTTVPTTEVPASEAEATEES